MQDPDPGSEPNAGLRRREFISRSAAAGGAFAGLWALPSLVREAYGAPVVVSPAARSVEGGLTDFTTSWQVAGPIIRGDRPARPLNGRLKSARGRLRRPRAGCRPGR